MFGRKRQVAPPIGDHIVRTGGEVCYRRFPYYRGIQASVIVTLPNWYYAKFLRQLCYSD